MTEVVNLMMEHFRVLRADIAGVKDEIASMRAEMRATNQHQAAFHVHEVVQDADLATLRSRIERIERRLDLID